MVFFENLHSIDIQFTVFADVFIKSAKFRAV